MLKNKSDVTGAMTEGDVCKGLGLEAIQTHHWHIMACSAMTGLNLHEGLAWVVQDAKARLFLY